MENKPVFTDKQKNYIGYILSFIIPVVILSGIFIGREVYPFGDSIYLRSDMYHQYAPFYKELYRKMTEGGSFVYSWNIGMGVNFTAIYSYYLASPVNLLLWLLAPTGNILITMDMLIVIKTGLCGLTCGYYLHKRFGGTNISYAAIAVFYALSSYMAAFSWNIMWLDCLVLLPVIVLGMDKLIKENKWIMYTAMLGISIFSNYYISIMICIFLVFYFIVKMLIEVPETEHRVKFIISRTLTFIKGSVIAGCIGACMILPEIAALSYTVSGEFSFPEEWQNYFSILDMLARSMMQVEVSIFNAHEPNLYCTIAVFMFVPLYFICKKINVKEKYGMAFLLVLFLTSFNMNIPNYLFHGMHFPNSLPARESFIYIFLLVTMVYQVIVHIDSFTKKQICGCFAGAVGVILLIEELYVDSSSFPFEIVYISLLFLTLYFILCIAFINKKISRTFVVYLLFIVCIAEATINSDHEQSYKPTGYSAYLEDNEAIEKLVSDIDDNSFYRIEKLSRKTKNDAAWNNYKGVSIFSSTANGNFTDMLGRLGFEKSTNAYSYYGYTPFTSALLNVKYLISNSICDEPYMMSLYSYDEGAQRYLYKLEHSLPFGFMLPSDFLNNWKCEGNNPFAVQNSFVNAATGYSDMFTQEYAYSNGTTSTIEVADSCDLYIYVTNYVDSINWHGETADENTPDISGSASGLKHRQIVHIGYVPAGTIVSVTTTDTKVGSLQLYAYSFHKEVFELALSSLSSEGFEMDEFDETYIKGTINANKDGIMYTSIIYDKGWTAYVDGKEVELVSFKDALLAVPVPAGKHTVELKYFPEGLLEGLIISCVAIVLFIGLIVYEIKKKKKNSSPDSEITDYTVSIDDSDISDIISETDVATDDTATEDTVTDDTATEDTATEDTVTDDTVTDNTADSDTSDKPEKTE